MGGQTMAWNRPLAAHSRGMAPAGATPIPKLHPADRASPRGIIPKGEAFWLRMPQRICPAA